MNREFVSYEQALALKELGFDEPCFGWFRSTLIPSNFTEYFLETEFGMNESPSDWVNSNFLEEACSAPTFSQAFRWFRENCDWPIETWIQPYLSTNPRTYEGLYWRRGETESVGIYDTYEEAELACLKKQKED